MWTLLSTPYTAAASVSNFLSIHSSPFLKTLTRPHIKSETLTKKSTEPWSNLLKKVLIPSTEYNWLLDIS